MAIDTETKRRAVLNMPPYVIAPVADGTIGTPDRIQAAWIYSGIAAGAAPTRYLFTIFSGDGIHGGAVIH